MAHQHHGLKLRAGFKRNADHDEQARGAKRRSKAESAEYHCRDNRNHHQEEGAKQREAVADFTQILARGPSGADAGMKPPFC